MNTLVSADTRLSSDRVVIVKAETFSSANNARGFALHHGWQVVS